MQYITVGEARQIDLAKINPADLNKFSGKEVSRTPDLEGTNKTTQGISDTSLER